MNKYYYIIDNDVVVYSEQQESLYGLNDAQVQFHLANPNANATAVLRLQLDEDYFSSAEMKRVAVDLDIKMLLIDTDAIVARHRDEVELGGETKISEQEYQRLLLYRKYLRDLSREQNYPFVEINPFQ